jgi:putative ABC transport system permease protein
MRLEHWFYTVPLRLRSLFRRRQVEAELDEELRYHLERKIEEYIAQGLSREEARYAAFRAMDGLEQRKEECRDMRRVNGIENLFQDLRYGLRMLAKSPGFTAVAVLTLALGIGANTAIFNVVNATLLQPLPIREGSRLVVIWISNLEHGWSRIGPAGQDYLDWKEQSKSFDDLFMFEHGTGTVTAPGEPEQVAGLRVTTNFGDFFGIKPVVGRTFRLEEGAGRHNYAVLGYGYWQRKFAGDPSVLGRGMTLNGEEYTIIGERKRPVDVRWRSAAPDRRGGGGELRSRAARDAGGSAGGAALRMTRAKVFEFTVCKREGA